MREDIDSFPMPARDLVDLNDYKDPVKKETHRNDDNIKRLRFRLRILCIFAHDGAKVQGT